MKRSRSPLFLARRSYRLRRLRDAARLLPIAGIFLWVLPILWTPVDAVGGRIVRDTAMDGIYIFAVWAGLVGVALALSRRLTEEDADAPAGPEDEA